MSRYPHSVVLSLAVAVLALWGVRGLTLVLLCVAISWVLIEARRRTTAARRRSRRARERELKMLRVLRCWARLRLPAPR